MFRRWCLLALAGLAGCQTVNGPLGYRRSDRPDDPRLPIWEQQARGRERFSYIEDDRLAPRTFVDRPSVAGR
jgi:hypothetical protein